MLTILTSILARYIGRVKGFSIDLFNDSIYVYLTYKYSKKINFMGFRINIAVLVEVLVLSYAGVLIIFYKQPMAMIVLLLDAVMVQILAKNIVSIFILASVDVTDYICGYFVFENTVHTKFVRAKKDSEYFDYIKVLQEALKNEYEQELIVKYVSRLIVSSEKIGKSVIDSEDSLYYYYKFKYLVEVIERFSTRGVAIGEIERGWLETSLKNMENELINCKA